MCDRDLDQPTLRSLATAAPERLTVEWVPLLGTMIEVTSQPVKLDGMDGPIVPVSARTAQCFADLLGGYCTSPTIEDLIWSAAAERMDPVTYSPNTGKYSQAMDWSARANSWLTTKRVSWKTLVSFGDKSWVLWPTSPGKAANYGLHVSVRSPAMNLATLAYKGIQTYPTHQKTGARVAQPISFGFHDCDHADYSQHCRLWRPVAGVDAKDAHPVNVPLSLRLSGL